MVISVTIGALFTDIEVIKSVMLPLSLAMCCYLAVRYRTNIKWAALLKSVVPFMALGAIAGVAISRVAHGDWLKCAFAIVVILLSLRELRLVFGRQEQLPPAWVSKTAFMGGGIIHGIYLTGGPLLVYGLGALRLEKADFRATISMVWVFINSGLVAWMIYAKEINGDSITVTAWLLIPMTFGMIVGELLHHRLPERTFKIAVYSLLLLAAGLLLAKTLS